MILTPLNIQVAIIKAFYALAKKSVKYYTGLAFGKNNTCLFKEIRLLRAYVDILRNFEIVGSTITCSCCVEGDYVFTLNSLSEYTNADIQFNCDNEGYLYYNNTGYPFIYFYDSNNAILNITFSNPAFTINITDVVFSSNCTITGNSDSPLSFGITEVPDIVFGPGLIQVSVDSGNIYSSSVVADVQEFITDFNLNNTLGFITDYINGELMFFSSFGDYNDYTGSIINFTSYYGGFNEYFITLELGVIGPITPVTPCIPTVVEESCLTNSQVSKIIAHINKLVR